MIQETRSSSVMGIFRSSITLGNAVTTTVWSRAVINAPVAATVRISQVECCRKGSARLALESRVKGHPG